MKTMTAFEIHISLFTLNGIFIKVKYYFDGKKNKKNKSRDYVLQEIDVYLYKKCDWFKNA